MDPLRWGSAVMEKSGSSKPAVMPFSIFAARSKLHGVISYGSLHGARPSGPSLHGEDSHSWRIQKMDRNRAQLGAMLFDRRTWHRIDD